MIDAQLRLSGSNQFYSSLSFHETCDSEDAAEFEFEKGVVEFAEAYLAVGLFDLVQEITVSERPFALEDFNDG